MIVGIGSIMDELGGLSRAYITVVVEHIRYNNRHTVPQER